MRRSRRNGQCVRVWSIRRKSSSASEDLFLVSARSDEYFAGGAGDKALAPELDALPAGGPFQAHAVGGGDITAVGHRVARWTSSHASCWRVPWACFSAGCQPMAVG